MLAFIVINVPDDLSRVHYYLEQSYQDNAAYVALATYWIGDDANSLVYVSASWEPIRQRLLSLLQIASPPVVLSLSYAWLEDIAYLTDN